MSLCGSNDRNASTWPPTISCPTFRDIKVVVVIPPSRVCEVVRDLLALLVLGGAFWLGLKYLRGCTSGKCTNGSTCGSYCLFAVPGSMEACAPPRVCSFVGTWPLGPKWEHCCTLWRVSPPPFIPGKRWETRHLTTNRRGERRFCPCLDHLPIILDTTYI